MLKGLSRKHRNSITQEPAAVAIETTPHFAIGQRALLVRSSRGNILWDCVALLDQSTIRMIDKMGGLSGIAISHPHYYTTMVEWSRAFGGTPIYLHGADRQWVMRPDPAIQYWEGETLHLAEGLTLIRCGGHFEGATVLHQRVSAKVPGILFSSDVIIVCADRRYVSFMRSYPNSIPLNRTAVLRIVRAVKPLDFDQIYGAFSGDIIPCNAKDVVARSAERYLKAISNQ